MAEGLKEATVRRDVLCVRPVGDQRVNTIVCAMAVAVEGSREMPLYDFGCLACENRFEELQRLEASPPRCPACGGAETERVITSFARPRPSGSRDPSWTPASTRGDAIGGGHSHHHHH